MSRLIRRCLLPLLLLAALPASAEDTAMLDAVRAFLTAEAAPLGDEVSVTLYPPAAHFPTCHQPTPFLRDTSRAPLGRLSVGVRCSGEDRRTRYLQAEVSVIGRYPVTAHAIEAGTRLTRDDLEERRGELDRLPRRALRSVEAIVGQEARRSLAAGRAIQSHQVRAPRLVERGASVILEAGGQGFRVTRQAEALGAGGRGERIRVRLDDRRILEGRIIGRNRLAVEG
ncbi:MULTISPECIES: flagellar basal body P-ring formation chaperone FlgA [Halomonas]|uniref:Flagella basal body P-ring formation protein FlgA n=1 Tax=Halomonas halophila TaxID=29573 RepID=A0ABQ0U7N4_9GAMM|nr:MULTISPECIES: flagellar basal body P-ring formation chaperone FlgA [Halomonas]MDR5889223.1 flagellar basal body P-ring formation chaperone FlgA [Halomonas salina]WJY07221.1 flagellar basal body P-ring formation chaperone FlgA [Halomonas halophila]GEK74395.1 flagellar basal body P-ring biosynthesis protein FlgA [Halomonas halophila]